MKDLDKKKTALLRALEVISEKHPGAAPTTTLARLIGGGLNHQHVAKWRQKGQVPLLHVMKVSHVTGIPAYELRPDMFEGIEIGEVA